MNLSMPPFDSDSPLGKIIQRAFSKKHSSLKDAPSSMYEVMSRPVTIGHQPHARRDFRGRKRDSVNVYGQPLLSRSALHQMEYIQNQELLARSPRRQSKNSGVNSDFDIDEFIQRNEQMPWLSSPGAQAERRLKQLERRRHQTPGYETQLPLADGGQFIYQPADSSSRFQGC